MTEAEVCKFVSSLCESWYPAAIRCARRPTVHCDVAEDTVQEAFFSLYRELRAGKTIGKRVVVSFRDEVELAAGHHLVITV
jgi:hypothetical protein